MGCGEQRGDPIHQGNGQLAGAKDGQHHHECHLPKGQALRKGHLDEAPCQDDSQHADRAQVQRQRVPLRPSVHGFYDRRPSCDGVL